MPANEILAIGMFVGFIALVFTGFPVAWLLGGIAIVFSALAVIAEADFQLATGMDWDYTSLTVERIWNVMENWVMVALPMFILMGLLLDRSGIANQLMSSFARLFGSLRGGLAITVTVIGLLLAATTGIIGASVVLLALLGLPAMLQQGYDKSLATGTVCAIGTLGILIPPSIMLVLMADRMAMSVGDLFLGAVFPGALLGGLYIAYLLLVGALQPHRAPAAPTEPFDWSAIKELFSCDLTSCVSDTGGIGKHFHGSRHPPLRPQESAPRERCCCRLSETRCLRGRCAMCCRRPLRRRPIFLAYCWVLRHFP